ncbi:MAG: FecR domain-containing protein, partial [Steroidobacteraceae bacterium]
MTELPDSGTWSGKMRDSASVRSSRGFGGLWLSVLALFVGTALTGIESTRAQEAITSCAPAVGRIVSLQGDVEVQRAGSGGWSRVQRLDTAICAGDRLRTAALSRAALFVQPETLVRVDQHTTITLHQSTDEIFVEFQTEQALQAARNVQSCGAGYFITRFPRKFKVATPHVNAAVEGTEFMVESTCDATKLTVLEGKVLSQTATQEHRILAANESIVAGERKPTTFSTVIKPADAVQWVLRYPALSDASGGGTIPAVDECRAQPRAAQAACLTGRAEALLRLGGVDEALSAIDAAIAIDSAQSDAHALRAIIRIAKNDKTAALESAAQAASVGPDNYRAWLAQSYAQQASFELEQALMSASRARALRPASSLVQARVAELQLSLGHVRDAEVSARAAVAANAAESDAHSILGFVHLSQIDINAAKADFETAIEHDSFNAMPRLGLGLAMIRRGQLIKGREQLEIAVALDPSNSLLRSYVGKAYYEENDKQRDELASTQFAVAKELDPHDPTPWFYDAILKSTQTRPAEAVRALDRSTELNDGRAVYRSRQLLDQDLASRGADQASVYNELGFRQLGVIEAARSLSVDPRNGSAHRFLADAYVALPRYEIARASELLQAQLRQPLGALPLQPQLANDVLYRNSFSGAATVGLNEFNPLFLQDGLEFQFFGLLGDDDTYGNQAIVTGLNGPLSFGVSQFASGTDGFRPNNDDKLRQYSGFVQWQASISTSAQAEVSRATRDSGDLKSVFNPEFFSDIMRIEDELDTQRLGLRHVIDARSDVLLSVIRQDRHGSLG